MEGPDCKDFLDQVVTEDLRKIDEEDENSSRRSGRRSVDPTGERSVDPTGERFVDPTGEHSPGERLPSGTHGDSKQKSLLSYAQIVAKQQRVLRALQNKKGSHSMRTWRQLSEPCPLGAPFGSRSVNSEAEESLCSDDGSDIYAFPPPEGDSAISIVRSVAKQHSRAHDAYLVALTELKRDADLRGKEVKKVLTLQGREIEALKRRRSCLNCARVFFAAFGLGLGLAHGLQSGWHPPYPQRSTSGPAPIMWR